MVGGRRPAFGAVRSGEEVMRWQTERIADSLGWPSRLFAGRFKRRQAATRRRLLESTEDIVRVDGADLPALWFREYMAHDPTDDLRAIPVPVLAITGRNNMPGRPSRASVSSLTVRSRESHRERSPTSSAGTPTAGLRPTQPSSSIPSILSCLGKSAPGWQPSNAYAFRGRSRFHARCPAFAQSLSSPCFSS